MLISRSHVNKHYLCSTCILAIQRRGAIWIYCCASLSPPLLAVCVCVVVCVWARAAACCCCCHHHATAPSPPSQPIGVVLLILFGNCCAAPTFMFTLMKWKWRIIKLAHEWHRKDFRGHVILAKCLARDIAAVPRRSRPHYGFRACHHSTRINSIRIVPLMSTAKDLYVDRRDCEREPPPPLPLRSTTHPHTNCIKIKCPQ